MLLSEYDVMVRQTQVADLEREAAHDALAQVVKQVVQRAPAAEVQPHRPLFQAGVTLWRDVRLAWSRRPVTLP